MATIEDSDKIKQEVRLLENLVRELETKSLTMESALVTKQHSLGALQKHCDDAKRWVWSFFLFCLCIYLLILFAGPPNCLHCLSMYPCPRTINIECFYILLTSLVVFCLAKRREPWKNSNTCCSGYRTRAMRSPRQRRKRTWSSENWTWYAMGCRKIQR